VIMKRLLKKVIAILCLVPLFGCGYKMVGKETHLPPGIASLAIPTFSNKTLEPGIEIAFTQAFLGKFIFDRRVKIVERASADAVMEGVVKEFNIFSVSYDASGYAREYRTFVVVDVLVKRRSGEILWHERDLSETSTYRTVQSAVTNEASKQAAIRGIAQSVSERVQGRFFYNF
jgi:outer membrane lipopolysaccharide assembly protein LptE/RlpB